MSTTVLVKVDNFPFQTLQELSSAEEYINLVICFAIRNIVVDNAYLIDAFRYKLELAPILDIDNRITRYGHDSIINNNYHFLYQDIYKKIEMMIQTYWHGDCFDSILNISGYLIGDGLVALVATALKG